MNNNDHSISKDKVMVALKDIVVCPKCRSDIYSHGEVIKCQKCDFSGILRDKIISTLSTNNAYFDALHPVMMSNNEHTNVFKLCYEKQIKNIEKNLKPGMVVLDVGCGPAISYNKPEETVLLGVEPSLSSLMANTSLDMQLHSSATELPLKDKSVDMIICLYSIHHMIGATKEITKNNVISAFTEFKRIVKPGGKILIFEVNPWMPFFHLETIGWNLAKSILKSKCDFYFWSKKAMLKLGRDVFSDTNVRVENYNIGWTDTFPPAFSLQNFKVPRFLYPFDVNGFTWEI